jgi:hypothetical protein
MSHKKKVYDIIEEKELCYDGVKKFKNKSLEDIASNPDCGMDWLSTFFSRVAGEQGWPTEKELIKKTLTETNFFKASYLDPAETWIQPTLDFIQSWLDGNKTDEEMYALGKENFSKVRKNTTRSSEFFFSKAVAILSCCPKNIKNITLVYNHLSMAVHIDKNANSNKRTILIEMVSRFEINDFMNDELKENVE